MKRAAKLIIAITAVLMFLAAVTATPCTVINTPCGTGTVFYPPTDFYIYLSDPVDPTSVQASDLTMNGIPVDSAIVASGRITITFHFNTSPAVPGVNTIYIPLGLLAAGPLLISTARSASSHNELSQHPGHARRRLGGPQFQIATD